MPRPSAAAWRVRMRAFAGRFGFGRPANHRDDVSLHPSPLVAALDAFPEGIVLYDAAQRFLVCNRRFRQLYPAAAPYLVGASHRDVIRTACRRSVGLPAGTMASGNRDSVLWLPGGQVLGIATFPTDSGGLLEIHSDRSAETRQAEDLAASEGRSAAAIRAANLAAERLNLARYGFAAAVDRAVRGPLNGVLGMSGLILDGELAPAQRHYAEVAHGSAAALLAILDDIIDLSALEAGKLDLQTVDLDLPGLIADVAQTLRARAETGRITVRTHIAGNIPGTLRGDPGRLRQILLNLAGGAVNFAEPGSIGITVTPLDGSGPEPELLFEIISSGGIPELMRGALLEGPAATGRPGEHRPPGNEFGLAICRRLIERMGGELRINDKAGGGSALWFRLCLPNQGQPSAALAEQPGPGRMPAVTNAVQQKPRILLAEDSRTNQMVALAILRSAGCAVDVVDDGRQALEAVRSTPYDLVLMDVSMPGIDGLEATARIRQLPGDTGTVPIIAMTAHAMPGDRESCLAAGMNDHISKPVSTAALLATVNRWLFVPAGAAAKGDPASIDPDTLAQLERDTDPAALPALLDSFIGEARGRAAAISEAATAADLARLEHEAHALASGAQTFGMAGLHAHARAIETACVEGRRADACRLGHQLPPLIEAATSALQSRLPLRA